jgi:uncharacterized protein (DUF2236 family)
MDVLRSRVARAVTDRLVGGEAEDRPVDTSGEPWLPLDSPARRAHADVAMLIGGLRALLLQSLHPVAMQAVEDHSDYQADPWGRFRRTAAFIGATTFGSVETARAHIDLVRRIHEHVTGVMPDGTPYHAADPKLLMWIHIAELSSFLEANRAYSSQPLEDSLVDRYVADMARTGEAVGVVGAPRSLDQLRARLDEYRQALSGSPPARRASRVLLWNPPITGAARAGYRVISAGAVASLPAWARSELGLPTSVIMDRMVSKPAARTLLANLDRAFAAEPPRRRAAA